MKKITFLAVLLWFILPPSLSAQVQVGTGTTNTTNLPITSCWGYSYTQQIYLSSEINTSGNITHVSFYYVSGGPATNSLDWTIYLGHTTKSTFASTTDWETLGNLSQVFSGNIAFPATEGWMTIPLTTPFSYNGTGNLMIAVDENSPGWNCSVSFRGFSATNRGIHYRNDSTNPDPTSPPTATSRLSTIPNIILGGITQACPTPSALSATGLTPTSATLGWTQTGSAASWDIELGAQGFTPTGTPTEVGVTTNPYNYTGLTPNTAYSFYVRANCGANGLSAWAGPFSFTTPLLVAPPYAQGFIDTTTPPGWVTSGWAIGSNTAIGGNPANSIYKNLYSFATTGTYSIVTVGPVTAGMVLSFDYKLANFSSPYDPPAEGSGNYIVSVSTDFGSSYTALETVVNDGSAGWQERVYDLTAYAGQNVRFRITGNWISGDYYLGFDNIYIGIPPTCDVPTALNVTNTTTTTATLNWTASTTETAGYEWVVMASGAAADPATSVATGTVGTGVVTASATGLSANTTYSFYVRTNCGGGDLSAWAGPVNFTTQLLVAPPYAQGFIGTTTPPGWNTTGWGIGSITAIGGNPGNSIYKNIWEFATTGNYSIVTVGPVAAGMVFSFDYKLANYSTPYDPPASGSGNYIVEVSTDFGSNYTVVETVVNNGVSGWQQQVYDLTAYAGQNVRFRITGNWISGDYYLAFDNIFIGTPPTCTAPTALTATNITTTTANLNWTASSTETAGYEWVVMASGAAADPATAVATGTVGAGVVTASATGLTQYTDYSFYVRTNCGTDGMSDWAGPVNFTTELLVAPPYTEGFVTTAIPAGWNTSGWSIGSVRGVTGNPGNNIYINLYSFTPSGSFELVTVGPIASAMVFSFDYKYANWSSPYGAPAAGAGNFLVEVSTDFGNNYTAIETIANDGVSLWQSKEYDLTAYVGQNVRFRITGTWVSGDFDLAFDNMHIGASLGTADDTIKGFSFYPNPAKDIVNISGQDTIETVTLYNLLGQKVREIKVNASSSQIQVSDLAAGTYLIKVTSNGKTGVYRMIKR